MKLPRPSRFLAGTFAAGLLTSSFGWAQMSVEKVTAINRTLQHVQETYSKLDTRHQQMLDGYTNIVHIASTWKNYGMRLTDPSFVAGANTKTTSSSPVERAPVAEIVRVSNPATDEAYSEFAGFTQSETSTARCGNSVVVGFNDSGSVFETNYITGVGGQAFSGASYSSNGGASFTDVGPINPGPALSNFLGGDPGVTCSDPNTFFFSQIFDYVDSNFNFWAAIAVNKSTDGGKTWGEPLPAISKSGSQHLLDKPWSTIDPSNPKRMFVSYTDFDVSGTSTTCGAQPRVAIEFVESDDGGNTWSSTPTVATEVCGSAAVQGSQMAVDSHGTLYISWVNLGNFPFGPRQIQVSSLKGGVVSAPVTAEPNLHPGGDSYYLQGEFRDFLDMAMAIDHSGTATDGAIYVTWADGRDKCVPDLIAVQGVYCYDDILLRQSIDGGNSWGFTPVKVNSDFQLHTTSGRDHYQSGVAVDNRGYVAVCWYDRRNDFRNFAIERYCSESTNGGHNFPNTNIGLSPFAPTRGNDVLVNPNYMGDYDQMTSDFTNANSGFIGAFQTLTDRGDPDVVAHPLN